MTIIPKQLVIQGADFSLIDIVRNSYSISTSVLNGRYSGDEEIQSGSIATVTITPNSGYLLPSLIDVSGAEYDYDETSGIIILRNPTDDVVISVECIISSEHVELEYLNPMTDQSKDEIALSYFRTGIITSDSFGFRFRGYRKVDVEEDSVAFGVRMSQSTDRCFCGCYNGKLYCGWNDLYTMDGATLGYHIWDVNYKNSRKLSIDGVDIATNIGSLIAQKEIIFPVYSTKEGFYVFYSKNYDVAGIEITNGSDVIHDFIPVRVGNVGCWYDRISHEYKYSDTEYEFVKGPDKV